MARLLEYMDSSNLACSKNLEVYILAFISSE